MECNYKPVERTGLYIMVFLILTLGPCGTSKRLNKINDRLDNIEQQIDNKAVEPTGTTGRD